MINDKLNFLTDSEYIHDLEQENQQLKQIFNEIKNFIKGESPDAGVSGHHILQILERGDAICKQ